ncbi:uncharacterized protein UV8b_01037 [Ustilaginoidea virens]|uniref:Uncharacterized protein n=1 Tax=Ustilaginoidea virens TaxID=1159556 RepID=A0A8E5HJV0_USTVR|nr:uncharacterized protein UV8b_01037 [Ustilaginoidea virens]QUC16796.1 hypothetical protein UV8b_01037 [Ustilaginoidea virens]
MCSCSRRTLLIRRLGDCSVLRELVPETIGNIQYRFLDAHWRNDDDMDAYQMMNPPCCSQRNQQMEANFGSLTRQLGQQQLPSICPRSSRLARQPESLAAIQSASADPSVSNLE